MYIFLNDKLVKDSEARVSVFDHGFLYGDGIYETMRAYDGVVYMLERHLERLARSAFLIRLGLPDRERIADAVRETLAANGLSSAYIRVTVSRGPGPIGLDPALCKEPTLVVIAKPFKGYDENCYREGMKLIIARTRRNPVSAISPAIKSLNFLNNILAKVEAKEAGADEALMLSTEGFLTEGTVSNIFFVSDGALCTPSSEAGILEGITRETVLALASDKGLPVREGLFYPDELSGADEVFFTNTSAEIMPVRSVGETGYPPDGKITGMLRQLFREKVSEYLRHRGSTQAFLRRDRPKRPRTKTAPARRK